MENMLDKALKVARSDTVKASGKTLFKDIIGILMYDPNAAWSMLEDVKKLSSTIRDGIFFECLETYILEAKYPVITGFLSQSVGIMQK